MCLSTKAVKGFKKQKTIIKMISSDTFSSWKKNQFVQSKKTKKKYIKTFSLTICGLVSAQYEKSMYNLATPDFRHWKSDYKISKITGYN